MARAARAAVRPGEPGAPACVESAAGVVPLPHAARASKAVTGRVAVMARRTARRGLELIVERSRGVTEKLMRHYSFKWVGV
ncbi:hypothetical protein GCM10010244_72260 [Streptomyces coeruleorubidus]|nr:hypothetical protein GCM10010244_72260 [Streptomyces bellus]